MTMIGQISVLWPSDDNFPAAAPFADTALNGIAFTGRTSPAREGCTAHSIRTLADGTRLDTCTRVARITPYRALKELHLRTEGTISSTDATAPTPATTPANSFEKSALALTWDPIEGLLP
jgi:hypothetical protein